jgi:hypothetical protein
MKLKDEFLRHHHKVISFANMLPGVVSGGAIAILVVTVTVISIAFISLVMSNRAPGGGARDTVTGHMTQHAADNGAFDTTGGESRGRNRRSQEQNTSKYKSGLHYTLPYQR